MTSKQTTTEVKLTILNASIADIVTILIGGTFVPGSIPDKVRDLMNHVAGQEAIERRADNARRAAVMAHCQAQLLLQHPRLGEDMPPMTENPSDEALTAWRDEVQARFGATTLPIRPAVMGD